MLSAFGESPNTAKSYFGRVLESFKDYFEFEGICLFVCLFVETLPLEQKWEHIGLDADIE